METSTPSHSRNRQRAPRRASRAALLFAAAVGLTACPLLAQVGPPGRELRPAPLIRRTESQMNAELVEQLASSDPAVRKAAIDQIRQRVSTARGAIDLRSVWTRPLLNNKLYTEAVDLTDVVISTAASDPRSLESALTLRIKALLGANKPQEALQAAKSLYNVSSMAGTSDAMLAIAECLEILNPDNPAPFEKFKQEQTAGAQMPAPATVAVATQPSTHPSTTLAGIKIDPTTYDAALKKQTGQDFQSLMARGNLLLMADRVKEARVVFDRMYTLASADLTDASEAIARCIKAEDGTIGRANAFVLAIRPRR